MFTQGYVYALGGRPLADNPPKQHPDAQCYLCRKGVAIALYWLAFDRLRDTVHGYEEQWWNPQVDAVDAFTVSWSIILQGSIFSRFPLGFRMTAARFCPCGSCQPYPQGLRMPGLVAFFNENSKQQGIKTADGQRKKTVFPATQRNEFNNKVAVENVGCL
ncbi:hypothetical protein Bbelb_407060 [Branchiostoma belcheri]|nr:hypothetical protein Bbelb_407060 [Branchiostoma belcheri]